MGAHIRRQDRTPSGNCAVEEGLPCIIPDERKKLTKNYDLNIPNIIGIGGLLITLLSGLLYNNTQMTKNKSDIDNTKKEIEQVKALNERDRAEMRNDVKDIQKDTKETKEMLIKYIERSH